MQMRNLLQLQAEQELGLKYPTTSSVIETTEGSRKFKNAILAVYDRQVVKDASDAKIAVVHFWQNLGPKPDALTEEEAKEVRRTLTKDVDICLNELKNNDHYVLEIIANLMEIAEVDTFDARAEVKSILSGNEPTLLLDNPSYMEKLKGLKLRDIGVLEINHATNSLRMAVVEVLTHKLGRTPSEAMDIIMMKDGPELNAILESNGVKTAQQKVEYVELNHHDHKTELNDAKERGKAAKSELEAQKPATPVISMPTAPVVVEPVKPVIAAPTSTAPVIEPTKIEAPKNDNVIAPVQKSNTSFISTAAPYLVFIGVVATAAFCFKNQITTAMIKVGLISNFGKKKDKGHTYGQPGEPNSGDDMDLEGATLVSGKSSKRTPTGSRLG